MKEHELAYCGLLCSGCPIYVATREANRDKQQKMRADIARLCKEHFDWNIRPEEVTDCDGCKSDTGRLFFACAKCEIRSCARLKKLASCAYCSNYACEKLLKFLPSDPGAKLRLDELRKSAGC
jgi:hypothetical protein